MSPTKLRSDSDLSAFPCRDDDTAVLSPQLVISVLASLLDRHIARSERATARSREADAPRDATVRAFDSDSNTVLDMSMQAFLERFSRYAHVSPQVYVVAYVYLDRLCQGGAGVRITETNVQRLLSTAIMVASKFVEDVNYKNSYFAKIGGLSKEELNSLELNFLFLMQFRLNVSVSVFQSYCRHLEREVSYGGGYQIERCLKAVVCSREFTSRQAQQRRPSRQQQQPPPQLRKLTRVL